MICWLLLYGATDQNFQKAQWVACFLTWMPKGSKPVEKAKANYKFSANIRTIVKEKWRLGGEVKVLLLVLQEQGWIDPNNVDK